MKKISIIFVLIILASLLFVRFPFTVNKTLEGICWAEEDYFMEPVTIQINGTFYRSILRNNLFKGQFLFDGISAEDQLMDITFQHDGLDYATISYFRPTENRIIVIGDLLIEGAFNKLLFTISASTLDRNYPTDKVCFSAPATDLQTAKALAKSLNEQLEKHFSS